MNTFDHLFLRHADRPSFKPNSWGHNVSITLEGKQASQSMGEKLKSNNLSYYLWSSPIKRCLETAEAICKGLESNRDIRQSSLLGDPGFFIQNPEKASIIFKEYPLSVLIDLYLHEKNLPGFLSLEEGCHRMLSTLIEKNDIPAIWVTHDICIAILACYLFKRASCQEFIPDFLEGIVIRKDGNGLLASYRGSSTRIDETLFKGAVVSSLNPA
jgi:broad specificity phosphatase PhoE